MKKRKIPLFSDEQSCERHSKHFFIFSSLYIVPWKLLITLSTDPLILNRICFIESLLFNRDIFIQRFFLYMCISKRNVNYVFSIFSQIFGIICISCFQNIFFLDCRYQILNKNANCIKVIPKIWDLWQIFSVT